MECSFDIKINEPDDSSMLFRPYASFRIRQLNMTPDCQTAGEIDYQINSLIAEVERLRKTAKNKLKAAISRHDDLLLKRKKTE